MMDGKALSFHLFSAKTIICLVAEHESKIVGYATFMPQFSTWEAGFYLYLDCLYIRETARGRGIGKQMMQGIIDRAKAMDCREIQWQTPFCNKQAIGFYRHLGATSLHKERFFFPDY
jgi:GNAT superfamily N-acetyltransferase